MTAVVHGRRRAHPPSSARPDPATGLRPRDAARTERRSLRRLSAHGPVRMASVGAGQKAGVALAATGIVLTIGVQTVSAGGAAAPVADPAAMTEPLVSAPADARVTFARVGIGVAEDPDGRLKGMLRAESAGGITPAQAKDSLGVPLENLVKSSPFGYRVSPIGGGAGDFHRGEDFVAQCGTAVRAASAGTVTFAGWHPFGGGNRVVIDHGNGLETTYNHLSSFSVKAGQKVGRGDAIALSGTTGASTGCHLHFEVMVNGEVVDPAGWL